MEKPVPPKSVSEEVIESEERGKRISARNILHVYDIYSFVFGYSFFATKQGCRCLRIWNRIRGGFAFMAAFIGSVGTMRKLPTNKFVLWQINVIMYLSTQVIYVFMLHLFCGRHVTRVMDSMIQTLKESQVKRVQRLSLVLTTLAITIYLLENGCYLSSHDIFKPGVMSSKKWTSSVAVILTATQADHIFHGCIMFSLMQVSCYYSCVNRLNKLDSLMPSASTNGESLRRIICTECCLIRETISSVNKFAGLPLSLLLIYTFAAIPGSISNMGQIDEKPLFWRITELSVVGLYGVTFISIVVLATVLKHKLETRRQHVVDSLLLPHHSCTDVIGMTIKWKLTLNKLTDPTLFDFSIMSITSLESDFIFSFTSSVITFSILFLQLESSFKNMS